MAFTAMSTQKPDYLGPYKILNEVGAGGLGKVYRALDEKTGRIVAIKVLHDHFTQNRKFLGIFHRELLILSSLKHKHIVNFIDSYFAPPICYVVTEFVDGWSGYQFMKRLGRIPPMVAISILIDMLQGIDHLHLHDVIHSDLSAANFLIEKTGRILVTDFGLACKFEIEDYRTLMIGTPGYYSPEHVSANGMTQQTDIYCAGLLLFEMLAGVKAVPASQDRKKTLSALKKLKVPTFNFADERLAKDIYLLLDKALQFSPRKRFSSAEPMMLACYEILKRHKIRYARFAIKQFLEDKGLTPSTNIEKQNIYSGM